MEKPTFPKPRIIREDFLPEPMKNYRIKKVTENGETVYHPQKGFCGKSGNYFEQL